MLFILHWR